MLHFKIREEYLSDIIDFYDLMHGYNVSLKVTDISMDPCHITDVLNGSGNIVGSVSLALDSNEYVNEMQNLTTIDSGVTALKLYARYSKSICLLLDKGYTVIAGTNTGQYQYLTITKDDGQSTKTFLHLHLK